MLKVSWLICGRLLLMEAGGGRNLWSCLLDDQREGVNGVCTGRSVGLYVERRRYDALVSTR